jgi:hypothetical protein
MIYLQVPVSYLAWLIGLLLGLLLVIRHIHITKRREQ